MKQFETEQENFWAGDFGDAYVTRNHDGAILTAKTGKLAKVLSAIPGGNIHSCLELGSNVGGNLKALQMLIPSIKSTAVEINESAAAECKKISDVTVINKSIFEYKSNQRFDLTFTSGVLIHINPDKLQDVYQILYEHSNRYILMMEYYNPTPVEVLYRGNKSKLFKRDFAGELLDRYADVQLVNYGFFYRRDKMFPADDASWFLMEKK